MKRKHWIIAGIAAVVLSGWGAMAAHHHRVYAEGPGECGMGSCGRFGEHAKRHETFMKELNLTDEQKEALKQVVRDRFEQITELRSAFITDAEALKDLLLNEADNDEALTAAIKGLAPNIEKAALLAKEAVNEIRARNILSPDQIELLKTRRAERQAKLEGFINGTDAPAWKERHGKGGFGRGPRSGRHAELREKLNISVSQKLQLMSAVQSRKAEAEPVVKAAAAAGMQLGDAILDENKNADDVKAAVAELMARAADAGLLADAVIDDLRALMTEDQLVLINAAIDEFETIHPLRMELRFAEFKARLFGKF